MAERHTIAVVVNGVERVATVSPRTSLLDCVRQEWGLTGSHAGCEHGACGACTMLLDGRPIRSCLMLAVQAEGVRITTIEGIASRDAAGVETLSPVQQGFWDCHGLQCGFCTPGMVLTATHLLGETPDASEDDIRKALSGNLCMCTGYENIVRAVQRATTIARERGVRA